MGSLRGEVIKHLHLFLWGHVSIHQNSILTATLIRYSIRIGEEKTTLIDKAKIFYEQKLTEGTSAQPQMVSSTLMMSSSTKLSEGWALRASKESTHFNENQKNFLDKKFKLGQETGYKEDPSQVASDMHRAKNKNRERRFAVGEFYHHSR